LPPQKILSLSLLLLITISIFVPAVSRADQFDFSPLSPVSTVSGLSEQDEQSGDRWLAFDKLAHFLVSLSLVGMSFALLDGRGLELSPDHARIFSAAGTALLGLTKEIRDHRRGAGFSGKDLAADGLGIALGITVFTFY